MSLRRRLSAVRGLLSRGRGAPRPYRPVFAPLASSVAGDGDGGALRDRIGARFFASPDRIAAAAERVGVERPAWREAVIAAAHRDLDAGLPVYSRTAPGLAAGFDWSGDAAVPGDPLFAVRPHRFAFLPRLVLAGLYGSVPAERIAAVLEGWRSHAARGEDPLPYSSNLVVIQRFLAVSWGWAFAAAWSRRDAAVQELGRALLEILRADAVFLVPRLGESADNNHLLADWFYGWYATTVFPELLDGARPRAAYEQAWVGELLRQTHGDGTSFEHSVHYHEFACELACAYLVLEPGAGEAVRERLRRMLQVQLDLAGPECVAMSIGDATEDPLFPLDPGEGWACGALRELYRALFDAGVRPAPDGDVTIERAFWLLGGDLAPARAAPAPADGLASYADGGFHVLAEADATTRLVFRSGPCTDREHHGGHAHADLLSVCLRVGGTPCLVDPGTMTYSGDGSETRDWRLHFLGPRAHGGPVVDGGDPLGTPPRNFRARRLAAGAATRGASAGGGLAWVEAEITGDSTYAGIRRGVVHVRGSYWLVYDILPGTLRARDVEFGFQLAAGAAPAAGPANRVEVAVGTTRFVITAADRLTGPDVQIGCRAPLAGWVSGAYGKLEPAPRLVYRRAPGEAIVAWLVEAESAAACTLRCGCEGQERFFEVRRDNEVDRILIGAGGEGAPRLGAGAGIACDGPVAWVRSGPGAAMAVRCLDASWFEWPDEGARLERPGGPGPLAGHREGRDWVRDAPGR